MRTLRSAFVVTVTAAACSRQAPPAETPPLRNPPMLPSPTPAATDAAPPAATTCPPRESLREGAPCASPGLGCYLPTGGCQPSGYQCADGVWREVSVTCNPPPPPRP